MPANPPEPGALELEQPPLLLRLPAVLRITGLSRSVIYRLMSEHKFPDSVRLGERTVAWRQSEIDQWAQQLPKAHKDASTSHRH